MQAVHLPLQLVDTPAIFGNLEFACLLAEQARTVQFLDELDARLFHLRRSRFKIKRCTSDGGEDAESGMVSVDRYLHPGQPMQDVRQYNRDNPDG